MCGASLWVFWQLYKEGLVASTTEGSQIEDMRSRTLEAERVRDELQLKLDSSDAAQRRLEATYELAILCFTRSTPIEM